MGMTFDKMTELKIRKGEPIDFKGLRIHPVTMDNYELFLDCSRVWTFRQSTMDFEYLKLSFIEAMWALEVDLKNKTGNSAGLFARLLLLLKISLRLDGEDGEISKMVFVDSKDERKFMFLRLSQGGHDVDVDAKMFDNELRPLIAEMNGLVLPNESENPDIVEAERDLNEKRVIDIDTNTDTLIQSVAYQSHVRERDIYDWTVREFENRRRAIDRSRENLICAIAGTSGFIKFNNGNPVPSWCFDKAKGLSQGLRPISEMSKRFSAVGDMNQAVASSENQ